MVCSLVNGVLEGQIPADRLSGLAVRIIMTAIGVVRGAPPEQAVAERG